MSDQYAADTAPTWDGTPDGPDLMSIDEAIAVLDLHAARAAKRGDYGCHADLSEVVRLLNSLAEQQL